MCTGQHTSTQQELDALNKIITAYLDIAEVHALNQEPMYMKVWLENTISPVEQDFIKSIGTLEEIADSGKK